MCPAELPPLAKPVISLVREISSRLKASAQSTTCETCISLHSQCTPWQPSLYSLAVNHQEPARAAALLVRCVQQICSLAPS